MHRVSPGSGGVVWKYPQSPQEEPDLKYDATVSYVAPRGKLLELVHYNLHYEEGLNATTAVDDHLM